MSSLGFILTEKCNWDCEYCAFPLIESPQETTVEILSKHLPYIKKIINKMGNLISFISVDGGELGLLPIETLQYFFKTIDEQMIISTNGKFLENEYHLDPIIRPYIRAIFYHVNTNGLTKYNNVVYGIVHNDITEMVDFIKSTDVTFNYVELEFDITKERDVDYNLYRELHSQIKNLSNVSDTVKEIIENRIEEDPTSRTNCSNLNSTAVLDMINERISLCQRSMDTHIPLTEENLIKRLSHFPKDVFGKENSCGSCTRLFRGKFDRKDIEDFFKVRRIWKI